MSLFPDAIACPEPVERAAHYGKSQSSLASCEFEKLTSLFTDRAKLEAMPVCEFASIFAQ